VQELVCEILIELSHGHLKLEGYFHCDSSVVASVHRRMRHRRRNLSQDFGRVDESAFRANMVGLRNNLGLTAPRGSVGDVPAHFLKPPSSYP
jgi:hypothetical protein